MNAPDTAARLLQGQPKFQEMLRHWRNVRRMSQLALATDAGISGRHLCFLETGRSQPSREMVRLLAQVLDIPLAEQNALLVSAGFAPVFAERSLEAPELAPISQALDFMLGHHEPYPALVLDNAWNIRRRNEGAARVFSKMRAAYTMPDDIIGNAMHVLCHPGGMRQFMLNWEECVGGFMQMLHREATQGLNQAVAKLQADLMRYPDMPALFKAPPSDMPMQTMRLRQGDLHLTFFVTMTTFAMPRDVTLQQIKIESFYPADDSTDRATRALAQAG